MLFSTLSLSLSLLPLLASAFPTVTRDTTPIFPPRDNSANFRLVANVTSGDLTPSINNYVLSSYHTGAGEAYAVLVPNVTATTGRIFYINGTAEEVRYNSANLLSDEGTPLYPGGVVINSPSTAGDSSVSINAGLGTSGVGIAQFPDPVATLVDIGNGGFYACEVALYAGPAVQLFVTAQGGSVPEGCAAVTLLPQCSEGSGAVHEFGQVSGCYDDVAAIDWTVYTA